MLWASVEEITDRFHSETYSDEEMDLFRQAEAEIWAENAWLRAAEAPTNDDLAFEAWEASRGLV